MWLCLVIILQPYLASTCVWVPALPPLLGAGLACCAIMWCKTVLPKSLALLLCFHLKFFHILVKVQFMMEALSETEASQV